jgi:phytoene dehydrogenase-like protein
MAGQGGCHETRPWKVSKGMRTPDKHGLPVVVAGAGLAGLAAGATAARAGARVIILESGAAGGRARTQAQGGFQFNQGPHALYRAGPGRRVLSRLGITTTGHAPPLWGARALIAGSTRRFPAALAGRVVARVAAARPASWAGASAAEWIRAAGLRGDAAMIMEAGVRVTTYVADLDLLPASVAIAQIRIAFHGVSYLDGGWEQLTRALISQASAAGAQIRQHTRAEQVVGSPGAWEVHTDSEVIRAAAVVVAAGRPAAASGLLPTGPQWADLGPPVTAACLDLGLRRPGTRFVLGIDQPLYLSPHAPPGDLAPAGCGLVHAMRYGARNAPDDRQQLCALAAAAGIRPEDVVVERFLPRMAVASYLPSPQQGLAGRPPVAVPGAFGLYLAGDWVGPEGWLSDGSLASGERAGLLAAQTARSSSAGTATSAPAP